MFLTYSDVVCRFDCVIRRRRYRVWGLFSGRLERKTDSSFQIVKLQTTLERVEGNNAREKARATNNSARPSLNINASGFD